MDIGYDIDLYNLYENLVCFHGNNNIILINRCTRLERGSSKIKIYNNGEIRICSISYYDIIREYKIIIYPFILLPMVLRKLSKDKLSLFSVFPTEMINHIINIIMLLSNK
jgi:hypothetical protein